MRRTWYIGKVLTAVNVKPAPGASTRRLTIGEDAAATVPHWMGRPMMDDLRGTSSIDVPRAALAGALMVFAALLLFSCAPLSYTIIEWQNDGNGFVQYLADDPRNYNTI